MRNELAEMYWTGKYEEYCCKVTMIENGDFNPDKDYKYYLRVLKDLIGEAVKYKQFETPSKDSDGDYIKCTRLCRVAISITKDEMEKYVGAKCFTLQGMGMFLPLEGYLTTNEFRRKSGFDYMTRKLVKLDLGDLEKENIEKRLTIAAGGGLFVPLKSNVTDYIRSTRSMKLLDMRSI